MPELDLEVACWLTSAEGLDSVTEVTQSLDQGQDELSVVTALRRRITSPARTAATLGAAIARRRARERWPDAERLVFTRESLEQASDPAVSAWRAQRFTGARVHDLCSGVGGDALAIARTASGVTAVDLDHARLVLLAHNARTSGLDIRIRLGDALDIRLPRDDLIHADPGRRRDGRRVGDPTRTLPPVEKLVTAHAQVPGLAIVLAPGTDTGHPALGRDVEVEYVQLADQLVEAVAWSGTLRRGRTTASATVLPRATQGAAEPAHRTRVGARGPLLAVGAVGDCLIEVAPAAVRARLHDEIGGEVGARRLARHRALLTADGEVPDSPWYRIREVVDVLPARSTAIRRWLAVTDRGPVELVLHGVDIDPGLWWREVGRPPRGPAGIRVELVRRDDDRIAIVTRAPCTDRHEQR